MLLMILLEIGATHIIRGGRACWQAE